MKQPRFGLGIDAGGTYTDLVVIEFSKGQIVKKAKSLTTPWDFTVGIERSLSEIGKEVLGQCELVSVSTTLATNAIVEQKGQKVGLLLMPPYGLFDSSEIIHSPCELIKGRIDADGLMLEAVDRDEVKSKAAVMIEKHHVKAFAVSGFAGCHNPENEVEVARILKDEFGLPSVCGHELSVFLNYKVRAQTALLNARIIPSLEKFFNDLSHIFEEFHLTAPIMVVKSDGSLMTMKKALERPIETILSGPAASVAGACYLMGCKDSIVIDMGGTTTDYAVISDGSVKLTTEGARVGKWVTHVRSLDLRTIGLGGDSLIFEKGGSICIGPKRVLPISRVTSHYPEAVHALRWLEKNKNGSAHKEGALELLVVNREMQSIPLTDEEKRILGILKQRPRSLRELAMLTGEMGWQFLPISRLEQENVIQSCGLTPTDLLHVSGRMDLWNREGASRLCKIAADLVGLDMETFVKETLDEVIKRITVGVIKTELAAEIGVEGIDDSPVASALVKNMLNHGDANYRVRIQLRKPILGIGAPAWFFLERVAGSLETKGIVPYHADVANAIGAITSSVVIRKEATIAQIDPDRYIVQGLPGAPSYKDLETAQHFAVDELKRMVRRDAIELGTDSEEIKISMEDTAYPTPGGSEEIFQRRIEVRIYGKPSIPGYRKARGSSEPNNGFEKN
jgi:N-methylhydantoinase A/oxoprolinase/acetone carboxylase beta subunit